MSKQSHTAQYKATRKKQSEQRPQRKSEKLLSRVERILRRRVVKGLEGEGGCVKELKRFL